MTGQRADRRSRCTSRCCWRTRPSRSRSRWCSRAGGSRDDPRRAGRAAPTGAADLAATQSFFAPCPRGLEAPLAAELTALGATYIGPVDGGVAFAGPLELAYRANLESRLASRVLWRVAHGGYRSEDDLYALVLRQDWPRHFRNDRTIRVDVAATRSPLTSLEFATLRIKDAVCDRFRADTGARPVGRQGARRTSASTPT